MKRNNEVNLKKSRNIKRFYIEILGADIFKRLHGNMSPTTLKMCVPLLVRDL